MLQLPTLTYLFCRRRLMLHGSPRALCTTTPRPFPAAGSLVSVAAAALAAWLAKAASLISRAGQVM